MSRRTLTFVTGNAKKLEEFTAILGQECNHIHVLSKDIDLPEYQGEARDVSINKCRQAAQLIEGAVVVEDTSLGFNAHQGLPGPYIKWYLHKLGVLNLHRLLSDFDDKGAVATCIFAFSDDKGRTVKLFQGDVPGSIVEARGPQNFGWDPCFVPEGGNKSYAEMSKEEKNAISHRAKALEKLKEFLVKEFK